MRVRLFSALTAAALVLTVWAMLLAYSDAYTDNPKWLALESQERMRFVESSATEQLRNEGRGGTKKVYPPGWVTDPPLAGFMPRRFASYLRVEVREGDPLWHTWLTGLYGERHREFREMWYAGGKLDSVISVEWRQR